MLDIDRIRQEFPALQHPIIYFDNPGGTQIARASLERIQNYLVETNANHGGAFSTSQASDHTVDLAREAAADFLNAPRAEEIVFGPNMTSLTFNISRALALTCQPGDRIVVSRLDHDANISPWLRVAEDRGCQVVWVDFDPEDCTLSLASLEHALEQKPHLVAVGYASNAVGTINPVKRITEMAHAVGSLVYIDAVQYAPHGPIDVQDIGCDFLVCSAYKYFGPHVGVLYGRYELLDELRAYRVRPAPQDPPGKFETGTGNFEGYAGVLGALEYLAWLGNAFGAEQIEKYDGQYHGRRLVFKQVMSAIRAYEYELSRAFLDVLSGIPGLRLYGQDDPRQLEKRVPTFAFRLRDVSPRHTAEHLARSYINVTDGNYYALAVTERLGVEASGGMVRAGAVHYNTVDEVHQLGEGLEKIVTTPL